MNSILPFAKPDYLPAAFSSIDQKLAPSAITSGIESTLIVAVQEDEGPEELISPLYPIWGEWLYWWDAIDLMEERLHSDDIVRKSFAPEDIVYHLHYIPYRGHKDDLFDSADMHFSYEDYEEEIFYLGPAEDEEIAAYTSPAIRLTTPDEELEQNRELMEDDNSNAIQTEIGDSVELAVEKTEKQIESPELILEAIRLLFVSGENIIAAKAQTH